VVARLQRQQHLEGAVEEDDLVLTREIVVAVALGELAVALARDVGRGVAERVGEAEADDVARVAVARDRGAEIGARRLDATRDQARRVEQRSVPVEDDQVEAARRVTQIASGVIFVPSRLRLAIRPPLVST
jgi:hypothetical protein